VALGAAFDFSRVFDSGAYVHRRRRFWPALSTDGEGRSFGYFLEVSFDAGGSWRQYLYAFDNLLDECGIWLSSDRLDMETWAASLEGRLRFRITAAVVSDERVSCVVTDGPVGSTAAVVDHLITLPRQFQYRRVCAQSILAGSAAGAREVDDGDLLYEFVRKTAGAGAEPIETTDIQSPYLGLHYEVGDKVTLNPRSRRLFGRAADGRSVVRIERVRMDFGKQCTDLRIVRQRK